MKLFSFFHSNKGKPAPADDRKAGFQLPEDVRENAKRMYAALKRELSEPVTAGRFTDIVTGESPLREIMDDKAAFRCSLAIAEKKLAGFRPEGMLQDVLPLVPEGIDRNMLLPYVQACCSTTMSALTQVRSERSGLRLYKWRCVNDERSNPLHVAMDGVICAWTEAPSLEDGKRFHPGRAVGCRCYASPVLDLEDVAFPAKCFSKGTIVTVNSRDKLARLFDL